MADKEKKSGKPSAEEIAARKAAKAKKVDIADSGDAVDTGPAPTPRLYTAYKDRIVPELKTKYKTNNVMALPRLEKIVISMGLGKAMTAGEKVKMEQAERELSVIAGQKPVRTKSKKSVSNF